MMKMILPLKEIPKGVKVTKIKGEKIYKVVEEITVYNEDHSKLVIPAEKGSVFLVDKNGNINAISSDIEVVWLATKEELIDFFNEGEC